MMLSGSAPLSSEVQDFLKCCFVCPFPEGYGLTETAGAACCAYANDLSTGHIGGVLASVKVRLRDIPEMNYYYEPKALPAPGDKPDPMATYPKGEICIKGSSIFPGYYKNPEKTAEAIDEEGWLHTGDVGVVLPSGAMKIIDRAKNIFKLAQGEYIAPEKLENVYIQSNFIAQIWVHGDSLQSHIICFIVTDEVELGRWAEEKKMSTEDALASEDLKLEIYAEMMELAKVAKFNSLEKPKQMMLLAEAFSVDNDLLTPTFKLKRNECKKRYSAEIEALYAAKPLELKK